MSRSRGRWHLRPPIRMTQWQSRLQTLVHFHGVEEPLPPGRAGTTRLKELVQR